MFEIITSIAIIIIALVLFNRRPKLDPRKFYFTEESYLLENKKISNHKTDFYLYTIAEFSEVSTLNDSGVTKELGFSDFIFVYDKISNKFMSARVRIIGADGYDRADKIGFYKFLSDDNDWIELNIRMRLNDYNEFVADLKEHASAREETSKNSFFLYDLSGHHAHVIGGSYVIYYLDSIKKVGVYDAYYADKIGLMSTLYSSDSQSDERQTILRKEFINRFEEVNS